MSAPMDDLSDDELQFLYARQNDGPIRAALAEIIRRREAARLATSPEITAMREAAKKHRAACNNLADMLVDEPNKAAEGVDEIERCRSVVIEAALALARAEVGK